MLAPKVTCFCKCYLFSNSNTKCNIVVPLSLCTRLWQALIYDELYIELNDVKGQTFAR